MLNKFLFNAFFGFGTKTNFGIFVFEIFFLRTENPAHKVQVCYIIQTSPASKKMKANTNFFNNREFAVEFVGKKRRDRFAVFRFHRQPFFEFCFNFCHYLF